MDSDANPFDGRIDIKLGCVDGDVDGLSLDRTPVGTGVGTEVGEELGSTVEDTLLVSIEGWVEGLREGTLLKLEDSS